VEGANKPEGEQARDESARHKGRISQGANNPGGKNQGAKPGGEKNMGRKSQWANKPKGETAKKQKSHNSWHFTTDLIQLRTFCGRVYHELVKNFVANISTCRDGLCPQLS